jgi:galactonate dehydratase
MEITGVDQFVHPDGNCFVTVTTDEGHVGIGEAGLTRRGPAVASVVRELEADLVGADPRRIEHLWQTMFRGAFFPGGVVQSAAVSAVDIALWDLKGKLLDVPVYELLGGRTRDRVPCYAHVEDGTIDDLVQRCQDRMAEGWRFVRWGLHDEPDDGTFEPARALRHGIEQVEAVREACGEELHICIDLHTRLDPSSAIEFCNRVEPYSPYFVEDPIRVENTQKLQRVRDRTSVPIAIGEQFDSKWAFRPAIENDLLDYCRVDVTIGGGLTEAAKIAHHCETHYVYMAPHNPGSLSPVAAAATAHLCFSSPLVGVQELGTVPMSSFTDAFPTQIPFEDGALHPPEKPGLGIEFDRSALEEFVSCEPTEGKGYERRDGSFTNW